MIRRKPNQKEAQASMHSRETMPHARLGESIAGSIRDTSIYDNQSPYFQIN